MLKITIRFFRPQAEQFVKGGQTPSVYTWAYQLRLVATEQFLTFAETYNGKHTDPMPEEDIRNTNRGY